MTPHIEYKLNRLAEIKGAINDIINQLSDAAWFLVENRKTAPVSEVEDKIGQFMTTNKGLLADHVLYSLGALRDRISVWKHQQGKNETVHEIINGVAPSFSSLLRAISIEENELLNSQKETSMQQTINITSSHGIQVGNNNFQDLSISIKEMLSKIESSNASDGEKASAIEKLRAFIGHPLVTSILGGISGGIVG